MNEPEDTKDKQIKVGQLKDLENVMKSLGENKKVVANNEVGNYEAAIASRQRKKEMSRLFRKSIRMSERLSGKVPPIRNLDLISQIYDAKKDKKKERKSDKMKRRANSQ